MTLIQKLSRGLYDRYWNARVHLGDWARVRRHAWRTRKNHGVMTGEVTLGIHSTKHR